MFLMAEPLYGRFIEDTQVMSKQVDEVKKVKLYPGKSVLDVIGSLFGQFLELFISSNHEKKPNVESKKKTKFDNMKMYPV